MNHAFWALAIILNVLGAVMNFAKYVEERNYSNLVVGALNIGAVILLLTL